MVKLNEEIEESCVQCRWLRHDDSLRRVVDAYTSRILMSGMKTTVTHNTCEDLALGRVSVQGERPVGWRLCVRPGRSQGDDEGD